MNYYRTESFHPPLRNALIGEKGKLRYSLQIITYVYVILISLVYNR